MFHNDLIFLYLDSVLTLMGLSTGKNKKTGKKQQKEQQQLSGSEGRLPIQRKKLIKLLENSVYYHPEKMLSKFPRDGLFEERAILLQRINQHTQALTIYARKLNDQQKAEEYCETIYERDIQQGRDAFLDLLKVYLKPADGEANQMIEPALGILRRHSEKVDPSSAMELLPVNIPISELLPFLQTVLSGNRQTGRNNQVVRQLRRAENLQIHEEVYRHRRNRVFIERDTLCAKCGKRLGISAFARYPNGVVVHYVCSNNKYVCPLTSKVFGPPQKPTV